MANDYGLVGDEDDVTYQEYLNSIHVGDMKYMVTFKVYQPIDLKKDLESTFPIRLDVELYAECPLSYIDTQFIENCKNFFANYYGEMVVEKGDSSSAFSNIKEMKANLFKGRNYTFIRSLS